MILILRCSSCGRVDDFIGITADKAHYQCGCGHICALESGFIEVLRRSEIPELFAKGGATAASEFEKPTA